MGKDIGIYIASKAVAHGPRWRALREQGLPILSSWIDESDPGLTLDWPDLWHRCLTEVAKSSALIVYLEPGEVLKGAWIEVGAALALGIPVIGVGIEEHSIAKSGKIRIAEDLDTAIAIAMTCLADRAADNPRPEPQSELSESAQEIRSLRAELEMLREIAIEYRKRAEASDALVGDCARYLKEGETPRQRMDRDQEDILGLMALLAKEKAKTNAPSAPTQVHSENPEKEIPDCPLCGGRAKVRDWIGNGFTEARVAYQQVSCASSGCGCQTPPLQVLARGETPALDVWRRRGKAIRQDMTVAGPGR